MQATVCEETKRLLEERMKAGGFQTLDEMLGAVLSQFRGGDWQRNLEEDKDGEDEVDPETVAAIKEGLAQSARGEGRPWREVRAELEARLGSR